MGDVEGVNTDEAEGEGVAEIFKVTEFPEVGLFEGSGSELGDADGVGDCEESIGVDSASSFESF